MGQHLGGVPVRDTPHTIPRWPHASGSSSGDGLKSPPGASHKILKMAKMRFTSGSKNLRPGGVRPGRIVTSDPTSVITSEPHLQLNPICKFSSTKLVSRNKLWVCMKPLGWTEGGANGTDGLRRAGVGLWKNHEKGILHQSRENNRASSKMCFWTYK